jgi:predicted nuclease with TOPRIM domain
MRLCCCTITFQSQKEELEKKLSGRDLAQEKNKQLQRELEEARHNIASTEDLNSVLSNRIQRLERDYTELETKNKELKKDVRLYKIICQSVKVYMTTSTTESLEKVPCSAVMS